MQQVYRARDESLDRIVVVKVPKNLSARKRFRRSAEVSAKVTHPNVAQTLDFLPEQTIEYLVEEFIEGSDLQARLDSEFVRLDPHLAAYSDSPCREGDGCLPQVRHCSSRHEAE